MSAIPLDEIEVQENYSEVELATMDSGIINEVKQVYYDILNKSIEPFVKKKTIEVEEDESRLQGKNRIIDQRSREKDQIREQLGD